MSEVPKVAPLLTAQQVADVLGVPVQTLYVWRKRGQPTPRALRVGKYLRFREQDVAAFVVERLEPPRRPAPDQRAS
jgi:excisionase family DNA binding protein